MDATALTTTEQKELDRLEQKIEHGVTGAKMALLEVRDQRLYRAKYGTFEAYIEQRWGWTRQRGYQLIEAAEVLKELGCDDDDDTRQTLLGAPNDRQLAALAKAPKGERAAALKDATESAPKKNGKPHVTAKHIDETVKVNAKRVEPPPADTTPSVKDENGIVLPTPDIRDAFEVRKGFKLVMSTMTQVKKDLNALANTPAGAYLDQQEIDQRTKDVRNLVKFAMPHALCPFCKGNKCKACKQSGWMPEGQYDQLKAAGEVK